MAKVTMCQTKAGKGYKVVIDGRWFYTSKTELLRVLTGQAKACEFRTVEEFESFPKPVQEAMTNDVVEMIEEVI